jgi:hypothetical protein
MSRTKPAGRDPRKSTLRHGGKRSQRKAKSRPASAAAAGVFLLCLLCYLANGRTVPFKSAADTVPSRLLPFSVLAFHTFTLDPFAEDFASHGGYRWYVKERQGHLVSFYPIGSSLIALPVYAPAWIWLAATGRGGHADLFAAAPVVEKLAASLLAALTVALVVLTLRRWLPARPAFWTAVGLGLGSSLWATASQMLWQHGPVALAIAAAAFFLTRPDRPLSGTALAGFFLSLGLASRPTAALFWLASIGGLLLERQPLRERLLHCLCFVAAGAPALLLSVGLNLSWYGSPLGGYSLPFHPLSWRGMPTGAAGLLLSPNRGLFVFTPIALLGVAGLVNCVRRWREEIHLAVLSIAAAAHFLVMSAYIDWSGGWSFGPRYMVDVLPILALAAGRYLPHLPRRALPVAAVALVWSIGVQWNGAFCYPASGWDTRMAARIQEAVWDWHHLELWEDFRLWRERPFWATRY